MLPHSPPAASRPLLIPRLRAPSSAPFPFGAVHALPARRPLPANRGGAEAHRDWRGERARPVPARPGCERGVAGQALTDRDRRSRRGGRSADPWTPSSASDAASEGARARMEQPVTDFPFPAEPASPPPTSAPARPTQSDRQSQTNSSQERDP